MPDRIEIALFLLSFPSVFSFVFSFTCLLSPRVAGKKEKGSCVVAVGHGMALWKTTDWGRDLAMFMESLWSIRTACRARSHAHCIEFWLNPTLLLANPTTARTNNRVLHRIVPASASTPPSYRPQQRSGQSYSPAEGFSNGGADLLDGDGPAERAAVRGWSQSGKSPPGRATSTTSPTTGTTYKCHHAGSVYSLSWNAINKEWAFAVGGVVDVVVNAPAMTTAGRDQEQVKLAENWQTVLECCCCWWWWWRSAPYPP